MCKTWKESTLTRWYLLSNSLLVFEKTSTRKTSYRIECRENRY